MGGQTLSDILFSGKNHFKALHKFFIKIAILLSNFLPFKSFQVLMKGKLRKSNSNDV